ncbi:uncharacterized protein CDAR_422831 [Caerostris darwini]|uniref:Uncharacterized protein n=1 Tax=Caerostris darwini TaxID=1538125 RepID=A0AAV4W3R1_9ARAC|nr:uncharacterized protein CDAR_422831 [Caerostris darwini]
MFDLQVAKLFVADYYFKMFHRYSKPDILKKFIEKWNQLLEIYSRRQDFITFEPSIPILKGLKRRAKGIVIVPFPNTKLPIPCNQISVFPLYPFRIQTAYNRFCCKEGLEVLYLYLDLTEIQYICFYRVPQAAALTIDLQDRYPQICIYGPQSLKTFFTVCKQATGEAKCDLKFRRHSLKGPGDTLESSEVHLSSPKCNDNGECHTVGQCPNE